MITVRVATPDDDEVAAEISALATAILRQTYRPKPTARASKPARSSPRTRLLALMHDRVVGTVQYTLEADRVHLIGLFVHPQFQGRGVARQLIQALTQIGQQTGARCLSLYTVKETGNVVIFEHLGFTTLLELTDQEADSARSARLTDVYMEKGLA